MVGEAKMLKLRMHTNFTTPSSIILTNHSSVSIYTLHWHTQKYRSHRLLEGLLEMYHTIVRSPLLTYLLTPWNRVLLERLTGSAASQEIPRIFGTRRFITYPEPTPSSLHNPLPLPEDPS
jgi:hypothetical protein